jgi:foldase protein PrsA
VIIAAVIGLVGVAYYQQYVGPFRQIIINIDGVRIPMGAFLERARLSGAGGMGTLQAITNEQLIKAGALRYGITVSRQEVDAELRTMAAGADNVTITDAEYREWYRQLLNENRTSDAKYRDSLANSLLSTKLQAYLASQIPAQLEHAHVFGIFVSSYEEAAAVKERLTAGEDFSAVAENVSIDQSTRENGGELGWIPQGVLVMTNMDPFMLNVGDVSDPLAVPSGDPNTAPSVYYVIKVTEEDIRAVDPANLPEIENTRFQQWLADETKQHQIKWNYNSVIDAWVNWQLTKGQPTSTPTPTPSG